MHLHHKKAVEMTSVYSLTSSIRSAAASRHLAGNRGGECASGAETRHVCCNATGHSNGIRQRSELDTPQCQRLCLSSLDLEPGIWEAEPRVTYSATRHAREIWREYLAIDPEGRSQSNSTDGEKFHLG